MDHLPGCKIQALLRRYHHLFTQQVFENLLGVYTVPRPWESLEKRKQSLPL